jgi:hypothetical protein
MTRQPCESEYDLDAQLERSVAWVKFAEAKNALMITAVGLFLTYLFEPNRFGPNTNVELILMRISLFAIMLLSIKSFLPKLSKNVTYDTQRTEQSNLYFFGDIAKLSLGEYRSLLKEKFGADLGKKKSFVDETHQIKVNCDLAVCKFKTFTICCIILMAFIFLLVWTIFKPQIVQFLSNIGA